MLPTMPGKGDARQPVWCDRVTGRVLWVSPVELSHQPRSASPDRKMTLLLRGGQGVLSMKRAASYTDERRHGDF